jgi:hypothetical protein
MEFDWYFAGMCEVLTKGGNHCRVFGESQPFPFEKGFSSQVISVYVVWVDKSNARVPSEIVGIEGEEVSDLMNLHHRD